MTTDPDIEIVARKVRITDKAIRLASSHGVNLRSLPFAEQCHWLRLAFNNRDADIEMIASEISEQHLPYAREIAVRILSALRERGYVSSERLMNAAVNYDANVPPKDYVEPSVPELMRRLIYSAQNWDKSYSAAPQTEAER